MSIPSLSPFSGTPPNRNTDSRTDFSEHVDGLLAWLTGALATYLGSFPAEANALASAVSLNKNLCDEAVILAQAAQAAAQAAANATAWVSGTTYSIGQVRFSLVPPMLPYRRILAGGGTTDPSLDPVNWAPQALTLPPQVGNSGKVLRTDGTTPSWGLIAPDVQIFLGSSNWYKPSGRDANARVLIQVWGGGGAGGFINSGASYGAGGGGGGAYAQGWTILSDLPSSVVVTVGSGGAGRTGNGYPGGSSSFGAFVSACGGGGGGVGSASTPVFGGGGGGVLGGGGTATGVIGLPSAWTFEHGGSGAGVTTGGPGTPSTSLYGGGGGGGALATVSASAGAAGMLGGGGGAGAISGYPTAGLVPGGGGGGCSVSTGGGGAAGGGGRVIITVF